LRISSIHGESKKYCKNFKEKFGGKEKMPTFAIPNEKKTFETTKIPE